MIIHGALVTHVHNAKMRSSLTCRFHICEVPTYEEKKKKEMQLLVAIVILQN